MKFSHREERRADRLLDVLADDDMGLRLVVSRLGAELVSLARRNRAGEWIGFLYRDNDITIPCKGWANHATVMGYYLHRLKNGQSVYRGQQIKGGTHGFLRSKLWHPVANSSTGGSLSYRITPRDFSITDYPLKVTVKLTYELDADSVRVRFHFTNDEPQLSAHLGFGLHPGFAATSFRSFSFRMPPGKYRRHFSPDNYLSGEIEDIEFSGGEMPFARHQLSGSYILELVDVPNREFVFSDQPTGREIVLHLTGVPYLTLWSDGSAFLCVEPCWGLTDHHQQRPFERKEGIQEVPVRGNLIAQFSMQPRFKPSG
jgi:galactose mutarotase-like enzyme